MPRKDPLLDTFETYGLTFYENSSLDLPITNLLESDAFVFFRNEYFDEFEEATDNYTKEQHLKDYLVYIFTQTFFCTISDLSRWQKKFQVNTESLPFPAHYLEQFRFRFFDVDEMRNCLSVPYVNAEEVSYAVGECVDDIFTELVPEYPLMKLFDPKKAFEVAENSVRNRIDQMDHLVNREITEKFKNDLYAIAVEQIQSDMIDRFLKTKTL